MNKISYFLLAALSLSGVVAQAQVKIGDNPTVVKPSTALEIESTNKAVLLPRVANTAAITSPVNGMMVYDLSSNSVKFYQNGSWTAFNAPAPTTVTVNCDATGFAGYYFEGVALTSANKFAVTITNNTASTVNYTVVTGNLALSGVTGVTVASVTPSAATPIAAGASQLFTFTLSGTPNISSSSTLTATFTHALNSLSCTNTKQVLPAITDSHGFVYVPVTGEDGRTWLNNNLGADYANPAKSAYNPAQQATSGTDYNAYGSFFQFGRKADGHELINYTSSSAGTPVNGTTTTKSDEPANSLFITAAGPANWRVSGNGAATLWNGVSSPNNPCPSGYRVPTLTEWTNLKNLAFTSAQTAANSALKIPYAGSRYYGDGNLTNTGNTFAIFHCGSTTDYVSLNNGSTFFGNDTYLTAGRSVRCIKD